MAFVAATKAATGAMIIVWACAITLGVVAAWRGGDPVIPFLITIVGGLWLVGMLEELGCKWAKRFNDIILLS